MNILKLEHVSYKYKDSKENDYVFITATIDFSS